MKMRLPEAAIVAMILVASPVLGAPALQQMGEPGATEVIIYTASSNAVVRHDSTLRLAAGENPVAFDWETEQLDPASIRLHGAHALTIGEVLRAAGEERLVRWNVAAPSTADYALTTSFLLSGLKWSADYRLGWTPGSDVALLGGWLSVTNETGIDLDNLRARFVLGRPGADGEEQATFMIADLRELAQGRSVRAGFFAPKQVPVRTIHRIDSEAAAERVKRVLEITPPDDGPLARTPLPPGPMTVVTPTDVPPASMHRARLSYEPSDTFEIDLGFERDVVVERTLMKRTKTAVEFDRLGKVSGFDTVETWRVEVRSRRDDPLQIELVETVLKTWELKTDAEHERESGKALMLLTVPERGSTEVEFTVVKHSGTRIP